MPSEFYISPYFPGLKLPYANNFEANRLTSFKNLSHNHPVFASSLAKAGFYRTDRGDEVKCAFCSLKYSNWKSGQVPWEVHRQLSPSCYLFNEAIETADVYPNIRLPERRQNKNQKITELVHDFLGKTGVSSTGVQDTGLEEENKDDTVNPPLQFPGVRPRPVRYLVPRIRENDIPDVPRAADGSLPYTAIYTEVAEEEMYSQFSSEPKRRETFHNFPVGRGRLVTQLILHGFFYTGHEDIVICYFCGLGLHQWLSGDDPKVAHARWSPRCRHLHNVVSSTFIDAILREMENVGAAQ